MVTSTSWRFLAGCTLLRAALSFPCQAQSTTPAPSWAWAQALGARTQVSAAAVVDAAGNTYELDAFLTTTQVAGTTLTSQGGTDVYLAKYTPAGTLAWVRQLSSAGDDYAGGLALDAAGNAYISGTFSGSVSLGNGLSLDGGGNRNNRLFVVRYSPQGTPEWAQQSAASAIERVSGGGIGLDATGAVYVTGLALNSVTLGSTTLSGQEPSVFLAKLSGSSGAPVSVTTAFSYAPTSGFGFYYTPALAVAPAGAVYVLSQFEQTPVFGSLSLTNRGTLNALAARYTAAGTFDWVRQLGNTGFAFINNACTDAGGDLYLAGSISAPTTFGAATVPYLADHDGYVLRCTAQGTLQWVQALAGAAFDVLSGLALDAAGNSYVTGTFQNAAQLSGTSLSSAGGNDVLVASFSGTGQLRWTQQAGGTGYDSGIYLGLDGAGNVRVLGRFAGTAAFGPTNLSTTASAETFLAQLGNAPLAARALPPAQPLSFFPNPARDQVQLPALPAGTRVAFVDALGRVARETNVAAGAVSVRGLGPGLYTLRATNAQGRRFAGRVLVE